MFVEWRESGQAQFEKQLSGSPPTRIIIIISIPILAATPTLIAIRMAGIVTIAIVLLSMIAPAIPRVTVTVPASLPKR